METTVLGVRLNKEQRERLKAIGAENKMSEVETVRLLVEYVVSGKLRIEKGKVVSSE